MSSLLIKTNKALSLLLLSTFLIACDGFDYNASDNLNTSSDKIFTKSELAFNVLYSSLLLNNSGLSINKDGFIVLFKTASELQEIELKSSGNSSALVGDYDWSIVDDKLQVIYPNGVTCSSNKTSDTTSEYTATSSCSGGEPNNDRIQNTFYKPNSFDKDDISERSVVIENDDDDVKIEFLSNDTFERTLLNSNGDEIASSKQVGEVSDSSINNVVRLDYTDTGADEYGLLILLDGGLSDGTMLELKYIASTDALSEVLIYSVAANNLWNTESVYDDIDFDE